MEGYTHSQVSFYKGHVINVAKNAKGDRFYYAISHFVSAKNLTDLKREIDFSIIVRSNAIR